MLLKLHSKLLLRIWKTLKTATLLVNTNEQLPTFSCNALVYYLQHKIFGSIFISMTTLVDSLIVCLINVPQNHLIFLKFSGNINYIFLEQVCMNFTSIDFHTVVWQPGAAISFSLIFSFIFLVLFYSFRKNQIINKIQIKTLTKTSKLKYNKIVKKVGEKVETKSKQNFFSWPVTVISKKLLHFGDIFKYELVCRPIALKIFTSIPSPIRFLTILHFFMQHYLKFFGITRNDSA